jgi:hypothetical protein
MRINLLGMNGSMPSTTGSSAFPDLDQFQEDIPEKYRAHLQRTLIIGHSR